MHLPLGFVFGRVELLKEFRLGLFHPRSVRIRVGRGRVGLKLRDFATHCQDIVAVLKVKPLMALPLVGVSDLGRELGELLECFLLGGLCQPVVRLQRILHDREHLGFGFGFGFGFGLGLSEGAPRQSFP